MDNRRRSFPGSFGARLRAAASVILTGAVSPGRFGPLVSAADWNGRFASFDDAHVDETTAKNISGVWACATLIADTMSQLPIGVYQRDGDRRLALPGHPVNRMLSGAVNDFQGRRALVKTTEGQRQLRGNAYVQIERNTAGEPVGLWPLSNAAPKRRDDGELIYEVGTGDQKQVLPSADVVHLRGLSTSTNGLVGESPIAAARNALSLTIHAERFGQDFFKNEARSGGFIQYPGKLTDTAKSNIRKSLKDQGRDDGASAGIMVEAGNRHHNVKVLEEGAKWVPTTIAPEEAQFLSTRQFQLEEIARWYRVPLVLIQSTEKTTSWGTGVEQLLIAFSQFTISPLAQAWEEELSLKLLTQDEREQGMYVRLDLRGMLRGDSASRASYYQSGIQNRWLLPNEARAREELEPLPGGDAFEAPPPQPKIE